MQLFILSDEGFVSFCYTVWYRFLMYMCGI